jgi:hypothetical protein
MAIAIAITNRIGIQSFASTLYNKINSKNKNQKKKPKTNKYKTLIINNEFTKTLPLSSFNTEIKQKVTQN